MATKYGDDYVTAKSLVEAIVMAVKCLDELRPQERVAEVAFTREGNQLIFPGWYVRVVLIRQIGTARYKGDTDRSMAYGLILRAAQEAHERWPDKDWDRGDFAPDEGRRVGLRLP